MGPLVIIGGLTLVSLAIFAVLMVIAAIPLYLALKIMGGKSTIGKVIFVNILVGVIAIVLDYTLAGFAFGKYVSLAAFIFMLFLYKTMFEIGWLRAFFAWILQFVIVGVFLFVLAFLGISIL